MGVTNNNKSCPEVKTKKRVRPFPCNRPAVSLGPDDPDCQIRELGNVPYPLTPEDCRSILLQVMVQTGSDGVVAQATNGKADEDSRSEKRRASKASILTPERLLEGLVDFPSIFSWDRDVPGQLSGIPGQMTVAALMKIGLVYSFVCLVKAIDTILRKIPLINILYTTIINIISLILLSVALIFAIIFKAFNTIIDMVPIRGTWCTASRTPLSGSLTSKTPTLHLGSKSTSGHIPGPKTFGELIDDLLHRILRTS